MLRSLLSAEEHALEIHVHDSVILLWRDVQKVRLVGVVNSSVSNVDIESTKSINGLGDDVIEIGQVRGISVNEQTITARGLDFIDCRLSVPVGCAAHDDLRAFTHVFERNAQPNSFGAASNNCDFVFEFHSKSPIAERAPELTYRAFTCVQ